MRTYKPLWQEGVILTPQHFQQQALWAQFNERLLISLTVAESWGVVQVQVDEETLAAGRLKLNALKLRMPDNTVIDTAMADVLPPGRDVARDLPAALQSAIVYAALPLLNADGANCRFDEEKLPRPRRYFREYVKVPDLFGEGVEEISVERHAVHLLFDFETHADDMVCPVARIMRNTGGQFEVDKAYVPPCLVLAAHPRHIERMTRLDDILRGKSLALSTRRRERVDQIAEFGIADVSLFWLLHCINTHWPDLSFLVSHPNQPPEKLYAVLSRLAGALMTFSTDTTLSTLPAYIHSEQDLVFGKLEASIRDLLDTIIPSRVIAIGLTQKTPSIWSGLFNDERLRGGADYYLSVQASVPALQLIEQIPKLCKIGSPDDIGHIVNAALAGIPLRAVQRVPAAIPVRLENQYFALDTQDPAHARMLVAHACQIYLPSSMPDASLELFAVLRT
ncbi:type VI secretion system baseplate subunit TssK [Glaciimonas sp. PAMC28666]|uniref:type VI secretion system baseplate subunit TssK n=1 Tax=Glaciimonas sp. PAMC28666 TaxID=2807626 RepID=UPI0019669020|nr:type VI secretion system baseplate subunit TssK [Glaciimonas sp. PAMC28666]QRX83117.1 type VI secretion system baseplate subunit TssK [Glaciimonas sp. PAMC28666]